MRLYDSSTRRPITFPSPKTVLVLVCLGLPWSAHWVYSRIVYQWLLSIYQPDCLELSRELTWEDLNNRLANSGYSNLNITTLATDLNIDRKTVSRSIVALQETGLGCYEDGTFFICPIEW
ncbi:MAG: hypothetical protein OSA89_16645 [Mariniblastus sp.]|nr:hypothetical protein [Mariniblastus sp.]